MQLSLQDEGELLFVGMHMEGGTLALRLGYDSRFHKLTRHTLKDHSGIKVRALFLHFSNVINRHIDLLQKYLITNYKQLDQRKQFD
jgi:hypothetical protein